MAAAREEEAAVVAVWVAAAWMAAARPVAVKSAVVVAAYSRRCRSALLHGAFGPSVPHLFGGAPQAVHDQAQDLGAGNG